MLSVTVFQFYEAQVDVIAQGMPTCVVTFIEYGNTEEVFLQDIRPCLPQMVTSTFQIMLLLSLLVVHLSSHQASESQRSFSLYPHKLKFFGGI